MKSSVAYEKRFVRDCRTLPCSFKSSTRIHAMLKSKITNERTSKKNETLKKVVRAKYSGFRTQCKKKKEKKRENMTFYHVRWLQREKQKTNKRNAIITNEQVQIIEGK